LLARLIALVRRPDLLWRDIRHAVRSLRASPAFTLGGASRHLTIGLAIGLISAWGLAELVGGFLFGIQPHDPVVFAAALAVLASAGLIAAFVPARRAARVDPVVALRSE
jgi:hypothetical protein